MIRLCVIERVSTRSTWESHEKNIYPKLSERQLSYLPIQSMAELNKLAPATLDSVTKDGTFRMAFNVHWTTAQDYGPCRHLRCWDESLCISLSTGAVWDKFDVVFHHCTQDFGAGVTCASEGRVVFPWRHCRFLMISQFLMTWCGRTAWLLTSKTL